MAATPILRPLTPEAREACNRPEIVLERLPFRVGRESRVGVRSGEFGSLERRAHQEPPNNDFYLRDAGKRLQVSREHFQIERLGDGRYELVDLGSTCGTTVDEHILGGTGKGGRRRLTNGSRVIVGTPESRFIFEFVVPA